MSLFSRADRVADAGTAPIPFTPDIIPEGLAHSNPRAGLQMDLDLLNSLLAAGMGPFH